LVEKIKGAYLLVLRNVKLQTLNVGKLGRLSFQSGYYVYVGSAMGSGGINSRVTRHLRFRILKRKKPKWHLDYLLRSNFKPVEVFKIPSLKPVECKISKTVETAAEFTFEGFGSSDCVEGCKGHLHYFRFNPSSWLTEILGEAGLRWEKQMLE
jgi:Uri superfamily endonuclease